MEFTCGARQCLSTQKSAGAYSRQRIMPDLNFVVGIVMAVVAMCSIIGNSLVFIVICWNQSLKKPLNLFLFNLAIADIGLSSTCIPYAIGQLAFTSSDLDLAFCYINSFIATLFVAASAMIIMILCFYQYLTVTGPFETYVSALQSCAFIVLGWLLAIALSVAPIFGLGRYEFSSSIFKCAFPHTANFQRIAYNGLLIGLLFVLPVLSLTICYGVILFYLRDQDTRTAKGCIIASVATSDGCLETGQGRTTTSIAFIYLVFVLFRTPFFVSLILSTWSLVGSSWLSMTDQIAFWAIYFHAASDPFVYAFQHGEFSHTLVVIYRTMKDRFTECCCCSGVNVEEGEKIGANPQVKKVTFETIAEEG